MSFLSGPVETKATLVERSDSIDEILNIIEFVSEYVEDDYQSNAVSVFDVIRTKKGDCTEYSLLFATLAKGMGYAVKEVSGWAYSEALWIPSTSKSGAKIYELMRQPNYHLLEP